MTLRIENLSKTYDNFTALNDINIDIQDTRVITLLGRSGSGKTSLLRIIAGLEPPSQGRIWLNGRELPLQEKNLIEYRKRLGFVFQQYNLFPHMSALENIIFPLVKIQGFSRQEANLRALKLLERFNLIRQAHKRPFTLSGGEQQRIAICRAIALEAEVLAMDEPTSALDPELTTEVLSMINELKEEGRDIILITHEITFSKKVSDFVIFLEKGKIITYEKEKTFFSSKDPLVKQFLENEFFL